MSATPLNNPEEINNLLNLMAVADPVRRAWEHVRMKATATRLNSPEAIEMPLSLSED